MEAMRTSQASARFMPAPAAAPLTAAMIGFGQSRIARIVRSRIGRPSRRRPLAALRLALVHRLHVAARAEAPSRAGDDEHAHLRVGRGAERLVEVLAQRVAERVQPLGAVQGERGDPSFTS